MKMFSAAFFHGLGLQNVTFLLLFIPGTQFWLQKAPPDPSGEQPKKSTIFGSHLYQNLKPKGLPKGAPRKTILDEKLHFFGPQFPESRPTRVWGDF